MEKKYNHNKDNPGLGKDEGDFNESNSFGSESFAKVIREGTGQSKMPAGGSEIPMGKAGAGTSGKGRDA